MIDRPLASRRSNVSGRSRRRPAAIPARRQRRAPGVQREGSPPRRDRPHPRGADRLAVLVRDHRRRRRLRRRLGDRAADDRGHPPDPPRAEPGLGHGPPHRHDGGTGPGRRVDRRRHDLPERRDPAARQGARGYDQVVGARRTEEGTLRRAPGAGQVVHPQARQLPHRDRHRRPQLRPAGVPPRRRRCSTSTSCRPGSRA